MRKFFAAALAIFVLTAPGTVLAHSEECVCGPEVGPGPVQYLYSAEPVWVEPHPAVHPVFRGMQEDMDNMMLEMDQRMQETFQNIAHSNQAWSQGWSSGPLYSGVNFNSGSKEYVITVNAPGLDEKDVKVEIDANRTITIRAEKEQVQTKKNGGSASSYNSFTQTLTLPEDADPARLKKVYKNGQLTITVPRKPRLREGAV